MIAFTNIEEHCTQPLVTLSANVQQMLYGFCVCVSALGRTDLHFIDAVVKVNSQYYREVLRMQKRLPDFKQLSDYFTFQQDGAPAHRAHETVDLLMRETPDFIPQSVWPANSPDRKPVDYKMWSLLQQWIYTRDIQRVEELRQCITE
jgi:hypothetical protein